jgi:hypothetical protein
MDDFDPDLELEVGFDQAYDDQPVDDWVTDHPEFPQGTTVKAEGWGGVAFVVKEVQGDWARIVMVGDDAKHLAELSCLTRIEREEFCGECGQIGCGHDGVDRDDD